MSVFSRTVRYRVETAAVHGLTAIVRLMPMPAVRATGAALGRLVYAVDGFHRRIAMSNMAMALPSKPLEERRAVVRRVFAHFGSVLLELIKVGTLTDSEILARIESEGEERVRQAHARGRGVLLFTGHFGYWEVGAIALALRVQPMAVMARPLDNPHLHYLLERIRTRSGNSVIYRQGAIRKVLQELAANRAVAILIDQHLHTPDAVYVDRPATYTLRVTNHGQGRAALAKVKLRFPETLSVASVSDPWASERSVAQPNRPQRAAPPRPSRLRPRAR